MPQMKRAKLPCTMFQLPKPLLPVTLPWNCWKMVVIQVLFSVCTLSALSLWWWLLFCIADARDSRAFAPIHCASQSGNVQVLLALLDGGSDANVKGYAGATPLHISVSTMFILTWDWEWMEMEATVHAWPWEMSCWLSVSGYQWSWPSGTCTAAERSRCDSGGWQWFDSCGCC